MRCTGNSLTKNRRGAFTLLELMLALALIVVATALIGSVMQLYAGNFQSRADDIRRMQLAKRILNMIAEDIRAVVTEQTFDGAVMEQLLGASASSDGAANGSASDGTNIDGSALSGVGGGSMLDEAATTTDPTAADSGVTSLLMAPAKPGIRGNQTSLTIDVSQLPRPEEYMPMATVMDATLAEAPGDLKSVSYFVQAETNQGVTDDMEALGGPEADGFSSGLVRRAVDRAVLSYSQEMADTLRLERTGDLIAPEVVSLDFMYFDGTQWLTTWDSEAQGLPWLVQITLAVQSSNGRMTKPIAAGTPLNLLTSEDLSGAGVEMYELIVAIPGAQLHAAPAAEAASTGADAALGL